jgi:hypothetical protein
MAMVLFEPRLGTTKLIPQRQDEVSTDGEHMDAVLTLAERLGSTVIVR